MGALVSSCSTNRASIDSYVDPTYSKGGIKSIAVFPIRNARLSPSQAILINKKLIQGIIKVNPNIEIISPSKAQRIINESEIASEWSDFIEDFYTSGIADKVILQKFSKLLKADAIFQGNISRITQVDGSARFPATTRVDIQFSILEVSTAKTTWSVTSNGFRAETASFGQFVVPAPPTSEAIKLSLDKVLGDIPRL
jgi:hypothetical protein